MKRLLFICIFLAAVVFPLGCASTPATAPPQTLGRIGSAKEDVKAAREELSQSVTQLRETADAAQAGFTAPGLAPVWVKLRALADRIHDAGAVLVGALGKLDEAQRQAEQDAAAARALEAANKELAEKLARAQNLWSRVALLAIVLASVGAGVGAWFKNLRLSLAAVGSGFVAVVLSVLAGVLFRWEWVLAVAACAVVAVIVICVLVEWKRTGSLLSTVAETAAPKET